MQNKEEVFECQAEGFFLKNNGSEEKYCFSSTKNSKSDTD